MRVRVRARVRARVRVRVGVRVRVRVRVRVLRECREALRRPHEGVSRRAAAGRGTWIGR